MYTLSSIDVNRSNVFDLIGNPVYLLIEENNPELATLIDGNIHVFNKKEDYILFNKELKKYEKTDIIQATLGFILYDIIQNKLNGICLHGFFDSEDIFFGTFISYNDLFVNRNIIEIGYFLMSHLMGEETNDKTMFKIQNGYFYFLTDAQDNIVPIQKDFNKNKNKETIPVFLTPTSAIKAMDTLKTATNIKIDSLLGIIAKNNSIEGIIIDPLGTINCFRDKKLISAQQKSHIIHWTTDNTNSYLKYISNSDKLFIVLSTNDDISKSKSIPLCLEKSNGLTALFYERKEDAEKFIDSRKNGNTPLIKPIGVINPSTQLKDLIINLYDNNIKNIIFNPDTLYHLSLKVKDVYKRLFDSQLIASEVPQPLKEFNILDDFSIFKYDNKAFDVVKHIIATTPKYGFITSIINLTYESDIDDSLFAISYIKKKYPEIWNNNINKLYTDFLLKLNSRGDVYLICDKKGNPVVDKNKVAKVIISQKYFNLPPNTIPIKINLEIISEIKKYCDAILFSDNNKLFITIPIETIENCIKEYTDVYQNNKLKFFLYFYFNTNLSTIGLELLFNSIIQNKEIYDEILYTIDNQHLPSKIVKLNDKTVIDFLDNTNNFANAYRRFIEYQCDIIPAP